MICTQIQAYIFSSAEAHAYCICFKKHAHIKTCISIQLCTKQLEKRPQRVARFKPKWLRLLHELNYYLPTVTLFFCLLNFTDVRKETNLGRRGTQRSGITNGIKDVNPPPPLGNVSIKQWQLIHVFTLAVGHENKLHF